MAKHLGVVRGTDDHPMYVHWTTAVMPYPGTFITVQILHTTAVLLCRPLMAGMTSAGVSVARKPVHPGARVDPMVLRTSSQGPTTPMACCARASTGRPQCSSAGPRGSCVWCKADRWWLPMLWPSCSASSEGLPGTVGCRSSFSLFSGLQAGAVAGRCEKKNYRCLAVNGIAPNRHGH